MLSHQKNLKFRLAQKLVGLTTLVLLAVSFGPQPAAGGQKSAPKVAKSKEADRLEPAKLALTNAVAAYFNEDLNGTNTKKFFEGWTDTDWIGLLKKNPGFYTGALNLNAGDPDLAKRQLELYQKNSNYITGAIAETFHWVQWRKKIEQIAKAEEFTEVEFLDEKTLLEMFPPSGGQRCDGLAIAKKSGNPPKRVILGVFESKPSARRVKTTQIGNFLDRIRGHYGDGQDVSLIRLNNGQTKLIRNTEDSEFKPIIEAAKSFHKESAQFLTGKDSIHFLFKKVSLGFAGNVMGQTEEQKKLLFDESLPLNELAKFINKYRRFPRHDAGSQREDKLAVWVSNHFEEYEEEIKDYLRDRGGVDEDTLDWALEVKKNPWKKKLPDLAEFIRLNKQFPNLGKDASGKEYNLATWLNSYFNDEKKKPEILDYLKGRGGINEAVLKEALETRRSKVTWQRRPKVTWQDQLPDLAKFINKYRRFPRQGGIQDGEEKLADWVRRYIESEKKPEILDYLEKHVDEATLQKALEDREKSKKPRRAQVPATDTNPDLGECDEELKGILSVSRVSES